MWSSRFSVRKPLHGTKGVMMKAIASLTLGIALGVLMTAILLVGSTSGNTEDLTYLVPGDYPTIQAAVDDPDCTEIELRSGVFKENVIISRTVII